MPVSNKPWLETPLTVNDNSAETDEAPTMMPDSTPTTMPDNSGTGRAGQFVCGSHDGSHFQPRDHNLVVRTKRRVRMFCRKTVLR